MAKQKTLTAAEHLQRLESDPDWVARRDARDRELDERRQRFEQEERYLVADLSAAGFEVRSVWELYRHRPYPAALPILMSHLMRPYSDRVLEGIARAIGVKEARPIVWEFMLDRLRERALAKNVADGAMAAVSAMAQPNDLPVLISLITDRAFGTQRIFLVANLMRSKRPEARATLVRLQSDPDLQAELKVRLKSRPAT